MLIRLRDITIEAKGYDLQCEGECEMSNHDENLFSGTFLLEIVKELNANVYITDIETNHIVYMNDTMKKDFRLDHPEGKVWTKIS